MKLTLWDDPSMPEPIVAYDLGPIELADDRRPWERQPNEPTRAWVAFTFYRDSAVRTLTGVAAAMQEAGIAPPAHRTLSLWRRQYRWDERAEAYDRAVDEETTAILQRRRRDLKREAAEIGATLFQLATARLAELLRAPSSVVKPRELIEAAKLALDMQRFATDTEALPALLNVTNVQISDDELLQRAAELLGPQLLTAIQFESSRVLVHPNAQPAQNQTTQGAQVTPTATLERAGEDEV